MTKTSSPSTPVQIIEEIFDLLNEQRQHEHIDRNINTAAGGFRWDAASPMSTNAFHQVLSNFVQYIYARGLRIAQHLSPSQALAEGIDMLDQGHQVPSGNGYDAALLDSLDPGINGVEWVLVQLADIIRSR